METDLVDICEAIIEEKLHALPITFQKKGDRLQIRGSRRLPG